MRTAVSPSSAARSETELLVLVGQGDKEAFASFYDHTAGHVFGLVAGLLVDSVLAENVTQDIFLDAWKRASWFDPARGEAAHWLLKLAWRRALERIPAAPLPLDGDPGQKTS